MRVLFLLYVVSVLSVCLCVTTEEEEWEKWKARYEKNYESEEEEESRRRAWVENVDLVAAHNARDDVTYKLELNMFADQLSETQGDPIETEEVRVSEVETAPKQFDWRDKHVVTAVKNQGMIGYTEAFVATGTNGNTVKEGYQPFLFQFQLELPIVDDVFGCVHNIGGLCLSGAFKGPGCANSSYKAVAQTTGTKHVPVNDEAALLQAVLKVPVFVSINASPQSFLMYKSGVYTDPKCTGRSLDHVLQLVGYGADDKGNPYWICRNSWGETWGMGGYVLLQRGTNRCGIAEAAKYPY